jgi:hypothetical protein
MPHPLIDMHIDEQGRTVLTNPETDEVIAILGEYRPQCEADTCYNGNRDLPAGWEPPYIHPVCKGDK